eukprot:scaffold244045_cov18-Tisochrysis_lutea.AAC.1
MHTIVWIRGAVKDGDGLLKPSSLFEGMDAHAPFQCHVVSHQTEWSGADADIHIQSPKPYALCSVLFLSRTSHTSTLFLL